MHQAPLARRRDATSTKLYTYCAILLILATILTLILATILAACPGPVTPTPVPTPEANLISMRADVILWEGATGALVSPGETRLLAVGQAVDVNDTGRAQLRFRNFLIVDVFRDTELQLESMAAPDAPPAYKFKLEAGTLYADVDPATEVVSIESDMAVITALGTKFWVHVRPGEITWVMSKEGEVQITAQGRTVTVPEGYQSWALPGESPHEPVTAYRSVVAELIPPLKELTGGEKTDGDVFLPEEEAGRRTATRTRTPTPTTPVPLPDLMVTDISVVEGNRVRCSYQNVGEAEVPKGDVWIAIYINVEQVNYSTIWTPIPAGQEGWLQTRALDVSGGVEATCVVDAGNDVVEANEDNNKLARPLEIGAVGCLPAHKLFAEIQAELELGCAQDEGHLLFAAWQPFEMGYMIWREDTRQIYVLVETAYVTPIIPPGSWQAYPDEWQDGMDEFSCGEAEDQEYPIRRGFGYLWCNNATVREALGKATGEEAGDKRFMQSFERGWAMHIGEWQDGIVTLTDDEKWEHFPR